MPFNIHRILKLVLSLSAAVCILACEREEVMESGVGYLDAPVLEMDAVVEDLMATKAFSPDVKLPANSEIRFVVTDKDGKEVYNAHGLWTKPLRLSQGAYSITATSGTNSFGSPYFLGAYDGTIEPILTDKPEISIKIANSLVRVTVGESLAGHFMPGETVLLSSGDKSASAPYGEWFFIPSGEDVSLTLEGTNSVTAGVSFNYTLSKPAAKTAYNVICERDETNWPTLKISGKQQDGAWANRLYVTHDVEITGNIPEERLVYEVSSSSSDWSNALLSKKVGDYYVVDGLVNGQIYYVRASIGNIVSSNVVEIKVAESLKTAPVVSAAHTRDGGGSLNGTDAGLDFGFGGLTGGILKELKDKGLLVIEGTSLKKGNTTLRTCTGEFADKMTVTDGWPYLPQGQDYTLAFTHRLDVDGDSAVSSSITGTSAIDLPQPSFTVTLGASYTSYDKYKAGDINTANNNCKPESLYNAQASWNISSDIMAGANYKDMATLKFYLDETESSYKVNATSYTRAEIPNLSWGTHKLKASLTFDGVTADSSEKSHEITGLPYSVTPPATGGNYPWAESKGEIEWNADHVKISTWGGVPGIESPEFHIPSDINVSVSSHAKINGLWAFTWIQTNYVASIGGSQVFSESSGKQSSDKDIYPSGNGVFTTSNNKLKCESSYNSSGPNVKIYSIKIQYR